MLRTQSLFAARALPRCRPRNIALLRYSSSAAALVEEDVVPASDSERPTRNGATENGIEEDGNRNGNGNSLNGGGLDDLSLSGDMLSLRQCSAIVLVKSRIRSIVDAYAIVRAIEQKYGALREYRFIREPDIPTHYQRRMYVVFQSPESRLCVPKHASTTVSIPAPLEDTLESKPGGPSLSDFEHLLAPRQFEESNAIPEFGSVLDTAMNEDTKTKGRNPRMLHFNIFQARRDFYTGSFVPPFGLRRQTRDAVGRSMLNWGGFYPIKPIVKGTSLEYENSTVDQIRMRRLLRKWSDITGAPNPFEVSTVEQTNQPTTPTPAAEASGSIEAESQVTPAAQPQKPTGWEPLPVEDAVIDDVPVPIPNTRTQLGSSTPASPLKSSLPQAPKNVTRLSAKLLPSTSQASTLDAEALLKASESIQTDISARADSAQVRARKEAKKKAKQQAAKPTDKGFSERLKKFIGSWF